MTGPYRRRFLDANEKTEAPGQHIIVQVSPHFADNGRRPKLQFAGAAATRCRFDSGVVSREIDAEFSGASDWWQWLADQLDKKRRTWVWSRGAHAAFCLLGGWEKVVAKQIRVGFLMDKDPPWVLRFHLNGWPCTWIDSRNFFQDGWAEGAPAIDCAWYITDRVKRLLNWHRDTDLGCLGFTSADMAMRAYRHRFAPRVIRGELSAKDPGPEPDRKRPICWPVPADCAAIRRKFGWPDRRDDPEHGHACCPVHESERDAYYGPLFVCHQLGRVRGPIYVVDCQSHYASVMRGRTFPAQYLFSVRNPDLRKAQSLATSKATVAHVRLCTPDFAYPLRRANRVGCAVGRFDTTLPGPELLRALDNGEVEMVYALHAYRPVELFTAFVDWFWNQRCAARFFGDKMIESLCKDVLVKMTGKWSQTVDRWEIDRSRRAARPWGIKSAWDAKLGRDVSLRFLGDVVQVHAGKKKPGYYFPAVSAYITSYARLHIAHVVDQIGIDEVLYNPVDCLHLTALGYGRLKKLGLLEEPALGKFKLERVISKAQYLGPGAYIRDDEPVVCGLPKGARHSGGTKYEYTRVESCSEVFCRHHSDELRTVGGSVDLEARQLWGRERADGRVFPPLLDEPDQAAEAEAQLSSDARVKELKNGRYRKGE